MRVIAGWWVRRPGARQRGGDDDIRPGLTAAFTRPSTTSPSSSPPRSSNSASSSCSRTATRTPASPRSAGGSPTANPGYALFELADRLRAGGWQVPAYTLTGTASDIAAQRILVRLGVSRDMASALLDDFRAAMAHFREHPVTVP